MWKLLKKRRQSHACTQTYALKCPPALLCFFRSLHCNSLGCRNEILTWAIIWTSSSFAQPMESHLSWWFSVSFIRWVSFEASYPSDKGIYGALYFHTIAMVSTAHRKTGFPGKLLPLLNCSLNLKDSFARLVLILTLTDLRGIRITHTLSVQSNHVISLPLKALYRQVQWNSFKHDFVEKKGDKFVGSAPCKRQGRRQLWHKVTLDILNTLQIVRVEDFSSEEPLRSGIQRTWERRLNELVENLRIYKETLEMEAKEILLHPCVSSVLRLMPRHPRVWHWTYRLDEPSSLVCFFFFLLTSWSCDTVYYLSTSDGTHSFEAQKDREREIGTTTTKKIHLRYVSTANKRRDT